METDLLKLDSLENAFQDMERLFRRNLDKLVELRMEATQKPFDDECPVENVDMKAPSEESEVVSSPVETAQETATEGPACSSQEETPVEPVVEADPASSVANETEKTPVIE